MEAASHQRTSENTPRDNTTLYVSLVLDRSCLEWKASMRQRCGVIKAETSAHVDQAKQEMDEVVCDTIKVSALSFYCFKDLFSILAGIHEKWC